MRRRVLISLVGVLLAGGAGWGVSTYFRTPPEPLPAMPNLERWPAEFRSRIAAVSAAVAQGRDEAWVEWGKLCHANGLAGPAALIWARLAREQPAEARWVYLQADLAQRAGKKDDVRTFLRRVNALAPGYVPAWIKRGDLALEAGELDEAGEAYAQAVALAPTLVWAQMVRLNFEVRHRPQRDTLARARTLAAAQTSVKPVQEVWANALEASGSPEEATRVRASAAALELAPAMADPWLDELWSFAYDGNRLGLTAMKLRRESRLDEGETVLKRAITVAPRDLTLRIALAHLYQVREQPESAVATLERAVADLPEEMEARVELARVLCLAKKPEEAVRRLEADVARWPERLELRAALGYSLREARRSADALPVLEEVVRRGGSYPETYYNLGYCLLLAGRKDQAAERLKRAVALRPGYVEAHFLLGTMAIERRDGVEAEQRAKAILGQSPQDEQGRALWGLAKLLQSENARAGGQIEQARQALAEGRHVAPGLISLWEEGLRLEVRQGEWERAQTLAQQWVEAMPENFSALLTWGDLEFRRGKNEEAKRLWQRAFSLVERGSDEEKLRAVRERLAR